MRHQWLRRVGAPLLALALLGAACGDDDSEDAATTTEAPDTGSGSGSETGEFDELCAIAEEIDQAESFPTEEQIAEYKELAPAEIQDAVETAGDAILSGGGDLVATLAAIAEDDVEDAEAVLDEFESENCGLEFEQSEGEVAIDESATRVDVTAIDYGFEFEEPIEAGPTSFVLTNDGEEAHFLLIAQIAEGHTLEEALAFEGDAEEAGLVTDFELETRLAAPGGEDQEVANGELEPGNYAMLCFIPGPDGQPHAFSGMAVPFTVA